MKKIKTGLAVGATVAAVFAIGTGGAVAGSLVTSADIKDGTVRVKDMRQAAVNQFSKPGPAGATGAEGVPGPAGASGRDGAVGPQGAQGAQGEKGTKGDPGLSNVTVGASYTDVWEAGQPGESIEECPAGQNAIGGGFSQWGGFNGMHDSYDLGGNNDDIDVTVSAPYFKGAYVPVDEAGNFRADQWVVRGFNHGTEDQIVRAWVVCADVK